MCLNAQPTDSLQITLGFFVISRPVVEERYYRRSHVGKDTGKVFVRITLSIRISCNLNCNDKEHLRVQLPSTVQLSLCLMCRRIVEVEQVGESKVLMFHTTFSTEVRVVEDDSDQSRLKTEFELIRSVSRTSINCLQLQWLCVQYWMLRATHCSAPRQLQKHCCAYMYYTCCHKL